MVPMPYQGPETDHLASLSLQFGRQLRRCRLLAGMSQTRLAEASGVSQSTISRLERGLAPKATMIKLLLLGDVLARHLPLAFCPHDHTCTWQRLDEHGMPTDDRVTIGSASYFAALYPGLAND